MGLCISLQDEAGESIETVIDENNLLGKLLPSDDNVSPILASIDWYGDTVFNRVQMKYFLREWDKVIEHARTSDEQNLLLRIKGLAHRCLDGVHLYLKFIGD